MTHSGHVSFEIVGITLQKCPDLLLVRDRRGYAPLSYSRQNRWAKWNEYLDERTDIVTPTVI